VENNALPFMQTVNKQTQDCFLLQTIRQVCSSWNDCKGHSRSWGSTDHTEHVCITMAMVCTVARNTATYFRLFGQKLSIVFKITNVDVF